MLGRLYLQHSTNLVNAIIARLFSPTYLHLRCHSTARNDSSIEQRLGPLGFARIFLSHIHRHVHANRGGHLYFVLVGDGTNLGRDRSKSRCTVECTTLHDHCISASLIVRSLIAAGAYLRRLYLPCISLRDIYGWFARYFVYLGIEIHLSHCDTLCRCYINI